LLDFAEVIGSDAFAQRARHPDFPQAFTRSRKLPLPALIATLLTMRSGSQQALVDTFFTQVLSATDHGGDLYRGVSDRAFAKARSHLHMPALSWLNDWVLDRAEACAMVPRWQGMRLVAADASVLMPAIRRCHRTRSQASADQRLFALYLPQAEITLHACVHSASTSERAMLIEALDKLQPGDVLLLDRGYPAAWLVALLCERGIRFVMRCDKLTGWSSVRHFLRTGEAQAQVTLNAPSAQDAADWGCAPVAPSVRVVRNVSTTGRVRVLATNLDATAFPAECFGDLYHARWKIEEAFKRLKHRYHLEAVSGFSQQALLIDVAAKVLADNLASLVCAAAQGLRQATHPPAACTVRRCNRSFAAWTLHRMLPPVLMLIGDVVSCITGAITLLARTTRQTHPGRSSPRPKHHAKPHARFAYKG
jgi:Transposase DDE domain